MDSSEREPIYVFNIEESYLFTHYFARTDIFSELREYYNETEFKSGSQFHTRAGGEP
jgi:hypothetical protein